MEPFKKPGEEAKVQSGATVPAEAQLGERPSGSEVPQAQELAVGQLVDGRYKILSFLGRGGAGCVYRVEQVGLKRLFALKTIHAVGISDDAGRRFQREARAASRLQHNNLVRAFDYGMMPGMQPFLVMELVEGQTLDHYLKAKGGLPLTEVLQIFIPICFGLAYAHKEGVVHRDIKPTNIILVPSEVGPDPWVPKIVDFGLARLEAGNETEALTKTGEIFGTPLYMSPEQCLGSRVDARSDIYSLGCVLYASLTGVPPFHGQTALETMMMHQSRSPLSLKEAALGEEFLPELQHIVDKAMAKDADDRYANCTDLAQDLIWLQQGSLKKIRAVSSGGFASDNAAILPVAKSNVVLIMVLCAVVSLAILGLVWVAFGPGRRPAQGPNVSSTETQDMVPAAIPDKTRAAIGPDHQPIHSTAYFSHEEGGHTVYDFGQLNLGELEMEDLSNHTKLVRKAKGQVIVPNGGGGAGYLTTLSIDWSLVGSDPTIFNRFRPTDLSRLRIEGADKAEYIEPDNKTAFDDAAYFISKLESLGTLDLKFVPVSDSSVAMISNLPHLVTLNVGRTNINGLALSHLATIGNLNSLDASHLAKKGGSGRGGAVINALQGSKPLSYLYLSNTDLEDADLEKISTMPNLKALDLSRNAKITDKGLTYLTKSKIQTLYLSGCSITPASVNILAKMCCIHNLFICTDGWTTKERQNVQNLWGGKSFHEFSEGQRRVFDQDGPVR